MRPLAAEALQHVRDTTNTRASLDYFTVDIGTWSPPSGHVSGAQVTRYSQFVSACVARILELYRHTDSAMASVVLIGHGVGGDVAKMVTMSLATPTNVQVMLTLQTNDYQLRLDREADQWYESVRSEWSRDRSRTRHVTWVSVHDQSPDTSADVPVYVPRGSGGIWCRYN